MRDDGLSWDSLMAAACRCHFHINLLEKLDENSIVTRDFPHHRYAPLFAARDAVATWWDSLPTQ
jgi:hypothetical protein